MTFDKQDGWTALSPDAHAAITPERRRSVVLLAVILAALLALAAAGMGYVAWSQAQQDAALQGQQANPVPDMQVAEEELPSNPIDFAVLQAENSDIYAWIYIPNTNVNLPILQSGVDDNYYLTHDVDGNETGVGALYTQSVNATDFADPVTVVYGHDLSNGGMFATLHNFEDGQFFAENPTFYVYLPGKILTYTVVSAYEYDDRHIMNSFDFSSEQVRADYFAFVADPDSDLMNKRDGIELTSESKIVQLSTCMSTWESLDTRYIVTGVLVDEQPTK